MEEFFILEELGGGSFGTAFKAQHKPTVESLSKLKHPNIVQLKSVFPNTILHSCLRANQIKFTEDEVPSICFQMFHGLEYMHRNGYFHRDLKPANVLVNDGAHYVTTRPYRAPEVLLRSGFYGPKICSVIGSPTWETWPEGELLAQNLNYELPQLHGVDLSAMIPSASRSAIQLISSLRSWDPSARPAAAEALKHPFFVGNHKIPRAIPLRQRNILPASKPLIFM
ncbi:unnamed protein product [Malus baccata var. baccata]